jgi:hypothetical protein
MKVNNIYDKNDNNDQVESIHMNKIKEVIRLIQSKVKYLLTAAF